MNSVAPDWLRAFFVGSVLLAQLVDFVVLKKQGAHEVTVPEAIRWSIVWVLLSLAFNLLFWWALKTHPDPAVAAKFHLLSYGLAVILVFIGTKMLLIDVYKIPVLVSLAVVVGILAFTMVLSVRTAPRIAAPAAQ